MATRAEGVVEDETVEAHTLTTQEQHLASPDDPVRADDGVRTNGVAVQDDRVVYDDAAGCLGDARVLLAEPLAVLATVTITSSSGFFAVVIMGSR